MRLLVADAYPCNTCEVKYCRQNCQKFNTWPDTIIEAEPVVHGEWIEQEYRTGDIYFTCSVCKEDWFCPDGTPAENNMHFCPCCGAKMDGGKDDG
jgi:hypothetical protein